MNATCVLGSIAPLATETAERRFVATVEAVWRRRAAHGVLRATAAALGPQPSPDGRWAGAASLGWPACHHPAAV